VGSYKVSFLAEVKAGEAIEIQSQRLPDQRLHFQGWRATDQKVVFAARLASVP